MTASGVWVCSNCSVEQMAEATYCHMCKFARPMDRRGVPQIFSGHTIHFNGIIPRTIMHPSHSVEWRMAERHGATCCTNFNPAVVSLLVYRPGYERSEKCRACIVHYTNIPCVPITWMLDSLLQSRQIHPSLYRLSRVLPVANPTVVGTDLPHHQHPYYQINRSEYSIPTSFPSSRISGTKKAALTKDVSIQSKLLSEMEGVIPPFFDIAPFQYTAISVFDAAVACATGVKSEAVNDDNDKNEVRKTKAGLELIAAQESCNKVDRALFSGMNMLLTPSLQRQTAVVMAIKGCGGNVVEKQASLEATLRSNVTHVIYSHEDKKDVTMITAAHLMSTNLPGLQMAQSNWLEDCLILGELLPLRGMYTPTVKLIETLNKKYTRARS